MYKGKLRNVHGKIIDALESPTRNTIRAVISYNWIRRITSQTLQLSSNFKYKT